MKCPVVLFPFQLNVYNSLIGTKSILLTARNRKIIHAKQISDVPFEVTQTSKSFTSNSHCSDLKANRKIQTNNKRWQGIRAALTFTLLPYNQQCYNYLLSSHQHKYYDMLCVSLVILTMDVRKYVHKMIIMYST